jgi:monofunctional biosynthetic peptidoglycan transglycosylase
MKKIIKKAALFTLLGVVGLAGLFLVWNLIFPSLAKYRTQNPKTTAFMEYRQAQWKAEGKNKRITRLWVPLSQISSYLVNAVIISEDDKFWEHKGFDWQAMREAMQRNFRSKHLIFGASTISQQLVKNMFLSPSRNVFRKAREAILTWRLERALNKKRILELYLNVVEWGDGIFGAEAASAYYFQTRASNLTPDEAARLAAILPQPRRYTPLKVRSSTYLAERSREIMAVMEKRGLLKLEEREPMTPPVRDPEIIKERP